MSELTWKQMHEAAVEFQADLQDKLSASQARIKASQEQEPAIKRYQEFTADGDSIEDPVEVCVKNGCTPLYQIPPFPKESKE